MELTYKELQKRDVINITDGKCLGRIVDMKFRFPEGRIEGIIVPGKKSLSIFCIFSKNALYIPERNIVKIGGDVILVDLSFSNGNADYTTIDRKKPNDKKKECVEACPPVCPPPYPPQCPPPCPPHQERRSEEYNRDDGEGGGFINFDDY